MSPQTSVKCQPHGFRSRYEYQPISFNTGTDLSLTLNGETGPRGISQVTADLLDFAAAIYQIERQLRRMRTNPPEQFSLRMQMRKPQAWNDEAINAAQDALYLLGDAVWELDLRPGLKAPVPAHQTVKLTPPKQIALLSGGMDSACGLISIKSDAPKTQLVSLYTRQKTLQKNIAAEIGYGFPSQWRMLWTKGAGPGHAFFFRSFLFLALAAAIAESWGVRSILQFENGVLARDPAGSGLDHDETCASVAPQTCQPIVLRPLRWRVENQ